ncbi:ABC transporter ATP-binding protein [bacterium]|nr:ABC transporter ATP-binding protein [bacterium]
METHVLNGVDFRVKTGDFVCLTGKSGAGKSTLLYQLGLLDHPDSGTILIDGVDVSKLSSKQRTNFRLQQMGYIFQDYALIPDLTASENIMVPLLMQGYSKKEARTKANAALDKVGLQNKHRNLPSMLSGGEQQRVAIARAICNDPKILFADEPTSNLDTANAKIILDLFKKLNKNGQTIMLVTHEIEYSKYGNRIFSMSDGIITEL